MRDFFDKVVQYSFYALFFFVPLILTPWNYELFEYNKMMLTYALAILIVGAWIGKMILSKRLILKPTPFDIPIALFFLSQLVSYFLSIDRHVSFWGYYSRFHGGLLSTITYILLYYAFVSNFSGISQIKKFLMIALSSGVLVAIYGILEHFGIDKHIWVQDVQNRVFSTLGQPNWLAAYLVILIPVSIAFALQQAVPARNASQSDAGGSSMQQGHKNQKIPILHTAYCILPLIFYTTLLFTKSRSGFVAFITTQGIFWFFVLITSFKKYLKPCVLFLFSFTIATIIIGTPFEQINTALHLQPEIPPSHVTGPALETGGTESGEIRKIVWKGAIDITKKFPLFGTGVETFAFSYYQFRPQEHNLTSEWDFLYNKAHNEYLNYAATTGLFGLGTYLLFIGVFIFYTLISLNPKFEILNTKQIPNSKFKNQNGFGHSNFKHSNLFSISNLEFRILLVALLSAWLSILITNFFGFSVVPVALFFWLIPAIVFVVSRAEHLPASIVNHPASGWQRISLICVLLATVGILTKLATLWFADTKFAEGYRLNHAEEVTAAYDQIKQAVRLNPDEPLYHDEFASVLSTLALAAHEANEASLSAVLETSARVQSDSALSISPNNVNFWKTRTRVFYTLGQIDEQYNKTAYEAIQKAAHLAPTDPKIAYNLALIQSRLGKTGEAIETLRQAIVLKPNYREPRFALALFLKEKGDTAAARNELQRILDTINPDDEEVKKKLEEMIK